tara:strand:+ start:41 stop:247 length:207 start_codon:yes stop_codon:yes gene_type:complete
MKKIFLTEFTSDGKSYAGPTILADNFADAEKEAKNYDVTVVGCLETIVVPDKEVTSFYEDEEWNRVLH